MQKFDNKGLGFSLNKVLFSIVLLALALAFSFPLLSIEKKIKCLKYHGLSEFEAPTFYKYTSNILGKQKFFVREGTKWVPFCKVTESVEILSREVGEKAIECTYLEESSQNSVYEHKFSIDFDLNFSKMCFGNIEEDNFKCLRSGKPSMCEVIED